MVGLTEQERAQLRLGCVLSSTPTGPSPTEGARPDRRHPAHRASVSGRGWTLARHPGPRRSGQGRTGRGALLGRHQPGHQPPKRAEEALRQLNAELEQRVTERTAELAQAIQTLERQATQLRALTAELTLAEQRERRRLADVLHDGLQQLLVATRLRAHMLGRVRLTRRSGRGRQEIVALIEEALRPDPLASRANSARPRLQSGPSAARRWSG